MQSEGGGKEERLPIKISQYKKGLCHKKVPKSRSEMELASR
jgi:hypothetical protein